MKIAFYIIKLSIALSCIIFLCSKDILNFNSLFAAFSNSTFLVLSGIMLTFAMILTGIFRWYIVMRYTNMDFSFYDTLKIGLIGLFFATFTPGGISGDIVRSYYCSRSRLFSSQSIVSVVIDKGAAFTGQLLTSVIFGIFIYTKSISGSVFDLPFQFICLFLSVIIISAVLFYSTSSLLFVYKNMSTPIVKFFSAAKNTASAFSWAVFISVINSMLLGISLFVFAHALVATDQSILYFLFAGPFIAIALTLPVTPAGIGVAQIAGYFLFNYSLSGTPSNFGAEIVSFVQIAWLTIGLIGAIIYITYKKNDKEKKDNENRPGVTNTL